MRFFVTLGLAMSLVACGSHKKDDAKPVQPQTTDTGRTADQQGNPVPRSSDTELQAEYQNLVNAVVIRVNTSDAGEEQSSSADMRLVTGSVTATDSNSAEVAYNNGQAPQIAQTDELDQDSSTASWHNYRSTRDYKNYRPRVYQRKGRGAYWEFLLPVTYKSARQVYYVYSRPYCVGFCRPTNPPRQNYPYPVPANPGQPSPSSPGPYVPGLPFPGGPGYPTDGTGVDGQLLGMLQQQGIRPVQDGEFLAGTQEQFELGRMLFFDPILSTKGDTACATCHMPQKGTSNGLSLSPTLQARKRGGPFTRADLLPRNSPSLFNRGHRSYTSMFWDSRVAANGQGGFNTPAGNALPQGLQSPLAAQMLFPIATRDEMLGCLGGGDSLDSLGGFPGVWNLVMQRILQVPQYRALLQAAYPNQQPSIVLVANAIAIFQSMAWKANNSPFDRFLAGDFAALNVQQKVGATYFYGKAQCSSCHSGPLQTDQQHHAIAIPQFGPGKGDGPRGWDDWGWGRVTGRAQDRYKFRTPTLRNVALSAPYGHDGAFATLRATVAHYTDPRASWIRWANEWQQIIPFMPFQVPPQDLLAAYNDPAVQQGVFAANEFPGVPLTDEEIDALVAFLESLTDPSSQNLAPMIPSSLPSGIAVQR